MLENIVIILLFALLFLTFQSRLGWRRKARAATSARERILIERIEELERAQREAYALGKDPIALQAKLDALRAKLEARRLQAIEYIKGNFKSTNSLSRSKLVNMIEECFGGFTLEFDYTLVENGMDSQDIIEFVMGLEEIIDFAITDELAESMQVLKIRDLFDVFGEIGVIHE